MVTLLLAKGANVNKVLYIHHYCWISFTEYFILNTQGKFPPLYPACRLGYLPIVEMLVSQGARIDQPTEVR